MTDKSSKLSKNGTPKTLLTSLFWTMIAVFALILGFVIAMNLDVPLRDYGKYIFPALLSIFLLLSIVLLIITIRSNIKKILKIFLVLASASALGTAAGILLENLLTGTYGEGIFFVIGVVIAPVGFLVGIIGSIVLFARKNT